MERARKRKLLLCLWLCLTLLGIMACLQAEAVHGAADGKGVAIDKTNFPDEAFRSHVGQYDSDKDGKLSETESQAVELMNVKGQGISDLTGIEHFTALKSLYCESNELSSLDVGGCPALKELL